MTRLAAIERGQYFPTPQEAVVARLAAFLRPTGTGRGRAPRILDPCAGEGLALAALAGALGHGAVSYGIELNRARAEESRRRLDHTIADDALWAVVGNRAFSLLFLNPPYDDSGDGKRRLEYAFLTWMTRVLAPGGLLIFVVPQRILALAARFLAHKYELVGVWRFPDGEFAAFRQVVLVAHRRARDLAATDPDAVRALAALALADLPPLPPGPVADAERWAVPALPIGEVPFRKAGFDADLATTESWRVGAWASPTLRDALWPPDERRTRPLVPLRKGHLALLIAAGAVNNVVLRSAARTVLVKGRTVKRFVTVRDDDESTVEREVIETTITLLDLATGAFSTVGARPHADPPLEDASPKDASPEDPPGEDPPGEDTSTAS